MWYWVTRDFAGALYVTRAERLQDQPTSSERSGPFETGREAEEELRLRQEAEE